MVNGVRAEFDTGFVQFPDLIPRQTFAGIERAAFVPNVCGGKVHRGGVVVPLQDRKRLGEKVAEAVVEGQRDKLFWGRVSVKVKVRVKVRGGGSPRSQVEGPVQFGLVTWGLWLGTCDLALATSHM